MSPDSTPLIETAYGNQGMAVHWNCAIASNMQSRRLEDRIRSLCAKVVSVGDKELAPAISDLQSALREHTDRIRKLAAGKLTKQWTARSSEPRN